MPDPNITLMPIRDYSLSLGEVLSKPSRHELCLLCLRGIEKPLNKKEDNPRRGRGRPQSPATVLAVKIGVSYDTIMRWRNPSAIQACDVNAVKLAEVAYGYDPSETIKILRADVECHRLAIESWVRTVLY
ncbi:hypothetical protein ES703_106058 [subsurface metagenome]